MDIKYDHKCPSCGSEWRNSVKTENCPFCHNKGGVISQQDNGNSGTDVSDPATDFFAPDEVKYKNIYDALDYIFSEYGLAVVKSKNIFINLLADYAPSLRDERELIKCVLDRGVYSDILENKDCSDENKRKSIIDKAMKKLMHLRDPKWALDIFIKHLGWQASSDNTEKSKQCDDKKPAEGFIPSKWNKVFFGCYKYFRMEEEQRIEWEIVCIENDKVLLLSVNCLDSRCFNRHGSDCSWKNSDIRSWLNGDFVHEAFSDMERKLIVPCSCEASANPIRSDRRCGGSGCDEDKIFLLSLEQLKKYSIPVSKRLSPATPYAKKQGIFYGRNDFANWWLRTPGYNASSEMFVRYYDGEPDNIGHTADSDSHGVRPAMWVDLAGLKELQTETNGED